MSQLVAEIQALLMKIRDQNASLKILQNSEVERTVLVSRLDDRNREIDQQQRRLQQLSDALAGNNSSSFIVPPRARFVTPSDG